jgi:folate-binding protein YgfZ
MDTSVAEGVRALRERRAWVDLSSWIRLLVTGDEAGQFLGDLVSGPVADLVPGAATRSLLLTPTGRIRADFTVARVDAGYLLVQDPIQPRSIGDLLAPYLLSAAVEISDAGELGSHATVGERGELAPDTGGGPPPEGLVAVSEPAVEAWRILDGRPRFPIDLTPESLPHEADLEHAIDFTKGCYLGQEAVAKVRNLGHPPNVVLAVRSQGLVEAGAPVTDGVAEVGRVTSAAEDPDGGHAALIRVRWDARDAPLSAGDGDLRVTG